MTPPVVLFSAGLDSAVLLADASARYGSVQPVYVRSGLAWEGAEEQLALRFLRETSYDSRPLVALTVDMRDVYPGTHWAVRGEAPAFDTPDEEVYLEGRNIVLLSKAAVYAARAKLSRILMGPLAGNPFPDATPGFFAVMSSALSTGLASPITIEAPFLEMAKEDVIALGVRLGVPFELTLSCMQPAGTAHCGRCSKCRERLHAFSAAGLTDPAAYSPRSSPTG
jgi:7-cyano-7-deazaguanine synthase